MAIDQLMDIIEYVPVALREKLEFQMPIKGIGGKTVGYDKLIARGMTLNFPYSRFKRGVALSLDCDNLTETLVHEAIHVMDGGLDEQATVQLTDYYYNFPYIKKIAQNRIVYELGQNNL